MRSKRAVAYLLEKSGWLERRWRRVPAETLIILMYHRVLPAGSSPDWVQRGMYVEADTFEMHAAFVKKHFRVVSLGSLHGRACRDEDSGDRRPKCAFTFDDGWEDVATGAFPILRKFGLPATVFLPTRYIGSKDWFWSDRISYLFAERAKRLRRGEKLQIPMGGHPLAELAHVGNGPAAGGAAEAAIRIMKGRTEEEIESLIERLAEEWELSPAPPGRAFLSWDEIRSMSASGMMTFGSHTHTHRILTALKEEEARRELDESKKRLLAELPRTGGPMPFCYPNGGHDERIVRWVEEAGYGSALTTATGWNLPTADPYRLRRIGIHQDMSATSGMLSCRLLRYL